MIDLHLHSKCSDGSLTPTELVERAKLRGVTALALTDHDTCVGNCEAMEAGRRLGLKVIPGVEFSVDVSGTAVHMLGYGIEKISSEAKVAMDFLKTGREERLKVMVARLNDLGIPISSEEVRRETGGEIIGRLHIARVLHRKRVVPTVREAFNKYLGRGKSAFVDRPRLGAEKAVRLIHEMGGVAVLAHPGTLEREAPGQLGDILAALSGYGLDGLEAHYSTHTHDQTRNYSKLALNHNLIITGGSDFHRPGSDGPEIGIGTGRLKVPQESLAALEKGIAARQAAA